MARINRLLVVEDDGDLRETLVEQIGLCSEFEVDSVDNAGDARGALQKDRIDLVIMDVGLPDMDGREAVRLIRQDGYRGPIIMLTAQASDADVVTGLDAGANDYVAKPFKFAVLLARIRAQLRTMRRARTPCSRLARTLSGPAPRCWSARRVEAEADREGNGDPPVLVPGGPEGRLARYPASGRSGATTRP
jgi:DNA-binding response OmpR family regulator